MNKVFSQKRWLYISFSILLSIFVALPVFADSTQLQTEDQAVYTTVLGKIDLDQNSYAQFKDINILPKNDGNYVTYTISIHNESSKAIQLTDYHITLESTSGTQYTTNLYPQDVGQNQILAGSSRDYHFYTVIDSNVNLHDLVFKASKWDFNAADLEKPLGQLTIPADYSTITPAHNQRFIALNGNPFSTSVQGVSLNKNEIYLQPTVYFSAKNTGKLNAQLPSTHFYIRTDNGSMYPLDSSDFEQGKTVSPSTTIDGALSGNIPVTAGEKGWELIVSQSIPVNNGTVELPVAEYALSSDLFSKGTISKSYHYTNDSGTYTVMFDSLQKWPWQDQDILAATFTIENNGDQTLPIPSLTGYYKLDHAITVNAKMINTDHIISLLPGQQITMELQAKIPYLNAFTTTNIYLEGADQAANTDILHISVSETEAMHVINSGDSFILDDIGNKWSYTVDAVDTFNGDSYDIFSVKLLTKNLEKRSIPITNILAQFRTPDGTVFPATVSQVDQNILPQEQAILDVWGTFPQGFDTSNLQLIIGEAITGNSTATSEIQADSFVKAVSYQLPEEIKNSKKYLNDLALYPYNLTINDFYTPQVDYRNKKITISFDYTLGKKLIGERNIDGQNYVLEMIDAGGNKLFSQVLDFEGLQSSTYPNLELGTHYLSYTLTYDKSLINMASYKINIYYQFQSGYKKLLAGKKFN